MDRNAGNGRNTSCCSQSSERKYVRCERCGCMEDSEKVKAMEDFMKKLEEVDQLRKYLDFFEAMLNAIKTFNVDLQENGEIDPLSIVVKGLLSDLDDNNKADSSGLPAADGSDVDEKRCQFIEKLSMLDTMVKRVERLLSRKTVRHLTKLFDDCQEKMSNLQVDLKKLYYILILKEKMDLLRQGNELRSRFIESLEDTNDKLLDRIEFLETPGKYLRKRKDSWKEEK